MTLSEHDDESLVPTPEFADFDLPSGWRVHDVSLPHSHFQLSGPADPDELLDLIHEDLEPDRQSPYWGAIWPAALATATQVLRSSWPGSLQTLELGCGLGLVGIAALSQGHRVTFSDSVPVAVAAAAANARQNGFKPQGGVVLDWHRPRSAKFDWVLASDVLYDRSLHRPLLRTIDAALSGDGECWLGDPGRSTLAEFVQQAVAHGFKVKVEDDVEPLADDSRGRAFQLIKLSRSAEMPALMDPPTVALQVATNEGKPPATS